LLSGKHVQGSIITDFLALQALFERKLTAVRGNVIFETLHNFYRTAIEKNKKIGFNAYTV
jgi:hypothetical protein